MQQELLFEIGTEEIPAGYIGPAIERMTSLLVEKLSELGLSHGEIRTAATPRRLAVCVPDLQGKQDDSREEADQ